MARYSYHGRLKQRINKGELAFIREEREPFFLRFFFVDGSSMPIRPHRALEYLAIAEVREKLDQVFSEKAEKTLENSR